MDVNSGNGPPGGPAGSPSARGVRISLANGEIHLRFAPFDPTLVARVRSIPGRRWDSALRAWRIPDSPSHRAAVASVFGVEVRSEAGRDGGDSPGAAAEPTGYARNPDALLLRFEEEMRLRGYGVRTRKAYVGHARRFLADAGDGSDLDGDLRRHVLAKLDGRGMSRSYHSQITSALRLFCSLVLGRPVEELPLPRPRKEQRLPVVLGREEFRRFLAEVRNPKHVAILALAYSAGLRVSEVVRLRPEDIDRDRGLIQVRRGKGRKDRHTLLSHTALALLDTYLDGAAPGEWLFPGPRPSRHLTSRSVQKITATARLRAGITKPVTPHVLRHSFATHLLESGTDVRLIQELLGHASVRTTEIYTHVSRSQIERIRNPLDEATVATSPGEPPMPGPPPPPRTA